MIFIHSGFRVSSTHAWDAIRKNDSTICYYEIFNEQLSYIGLNKINEISSKIWNSKHPDGAPYFLEYMNLIRDEGGVIGFDESFSYECAVPKDGPQGSISERETIYVRALINHAETRGKIPVLTAVRSLGRVAGLKAAAPGLHVLLYRNLFQQWCSYTEQALTGNRYFIESTNKIIKFNTHDNTLVNLHTMFPDGAPSEKNINSFYLFVFVHIYFYSQAAGNADHILDMNRIASEPVYRKSIEEIFLNQNLAVDFSETKNSISYFLTNISCHTEMAETVRVVGNAIADKAPSLVGKQFALQVIDDLLEEFDRHSFYAKGAYSLLARSDTRHEAAVAEIEAARHEHASLHDARNAALAEAERARGERDDIRVTRDDAMAELERLRHEHEHVFTARAAALTETEQLRNEHDDMRAARDAATAQTEQLRNEHDDMRNARDAAIAQIEQFRKEHDDMRAARDAATAQTEQLRSEHDDMRNARDAAIAQIEQFRKEHDDMRNARDAAIAQTEQFRKEHDDMRNARDAALAETSQLRNEHDDMRNTRDATVAETEQLRHEQDGMRNARDAAIAQIEELRDENADIRTAQDAAIGESRQAHEMHGLLETQYAQLLHWSVALHDSMVRSLSWRLTKPLRRLGLGRPNRPQRPSFLD